MAILQTRDTKTSHMRCYTDGYEDVCRTLIRAIEDGLQCIIQLDLDNTTLCVIEFGPLIEDIAGAEYIQRVPVYTLNPIADFRCTV